MRTRTAMLFTAAISAVLMFFLGYYFGDQFIFSAVPTLTPTATAAVLEGGAVAGTPTAVAAVSPSPTVDTEATDSAVAARA